VHGTVSPPHTRTRGLRDMRGGNCLIDALTHTGLTRPRKSCQGALICRRKQGIPHLLRGGGRPLSVTEPATRKAAPTIAWIIWIGVRPHRFAKHKGRGCMKTEMVYNLGDTQNPFWPEGRVLSGCTPLGWRFYLLSHDFIAYLRPLRQAP
jgi:hypothetical protein